MAAPTRPNGATANGTEKWLWVPAIASLAAPKLTETSAAGALDISCMLFDDWDRPSRDENRGKVKARVCDTTVPESFGPGSAKGGMLKVAVDPQAAGGSAGKKAYETLVDFTSGFLVTRPGLGVNTDLAVGQFVIAYPVTLDKKVVIRSGDDDFAEWSFNLPYAISATPGDLVALVA